MRSQFAAKPIENRQISLQDTRAKPLRNQNGQLQIQMHAIPNKHLLPLESKIIFLNRIYVLENTAILQSEVLSFVDLSFLLRKPTFLVWANLGSFDSADGVDGPGFFETLIA